jgi:hypothetical protein
MDFEHLQRVSEQAGFRVDWAALTGLTAHHPEPVLDWVSAAGQYAAADTAHRLLAATAATLRDQVAGTAPQHLYQYADQLSEICDLLTQAGHARDDAMDELSSCCLQLAALDPAALIADPDGPAGPAPGTWPSAGPAWWPTPARPGACRGLPPRPTRRPRRHPPAV